MQAIGSMLNSGDPQRSNRGVRIDFRAVSWTVHKIRGAVIKKALTPLQLSCKPTRVKNTAEESAQ